MCRTPHGVRGLKSFASSAQRKSIACRTPHGVRGLKYVLLHLPLLQKRRTPHGVRGLKSRRFAQVFPARRVAPLTGCVD